MSRTFNYIEILGNDIVKSVAAKTVEKSDEYKRLEPTLYSKNFISSIFYGMNYSDFQNSEVDSVTKYLHTDYIGLNEFVFISGSETPDSFQDYLTQKLATLDPNVLLINSFNNTNDESGEYFTVCKDATHGDYSICFAFINSEFDSSKTKKSKLKNLANQLSWKCESLEKIIKFC